MVRSKEQEAVQHKISTVTEGTSMSVTQSERGLPVRQPSWFECGEGGIRTLAHSPRNTANPDADGAESGALATRATSDLALAKLVDAWPTLPDAIRAGILAMVQAAVG